MKIAATPALLCFLLLSLCSCSLFKDKGGDGVKPAIPYEKESIVLKIRSDPQLNLFQGQPHSLALCTYQMKDPNAFNQLTDEKNGLSRLMECERFDASVLSSKRIIVHPSQQVKEVRDRAEGARYLGFVAGYYPLEKSRVILLYPLPYPSSRGGSKELVINLDLGQRQIQLVK
ncbi:MAG: type VI secretion system lipoprotein TssJ [Geobacteraceae bacterium]|nr:type VI secretion system lipoprotein TssJ [Geobacteraceae bacterium]